MRDTKKAFLWIISILRKRGVPFKIAGGFAAKVYGSERELADIDIEIPERKFNTILDDIRPYIVYGPKNYKDKNWDLLLITLKYAGQVIDLAGKEKMRIFDKTKGKWIYLRNRTTSKRNVYGTVVNIVGKKELISYKSKLLRNVDKKDVSSLTSDG